MRNRAPPNCAWTGAIWGWPAPPTVAIATSRTLRQNSTNSAADICRPRYATESATDAVAVAVLRSSSACRRASSASEQGCSCSSCAAGCSRLRMVVNLDRSTLRTQRSGAGREGTGQAVVQQAAAVGMKAHRGKLADELAAQRGFAVHGVDSKPGLQSDDGRDRGAKLLGVDRRKTHQIAAGQAPDRTPAGDADEMVGFARHAASGPR